MIASIGNYILTKKALRSDTAANEHIWAGEGNGDDDVTSLERWAGDATTRGKFSRTVGGRRLWLLLSNPTVKGLFLGWIGPLGQVGEPLGPTFLRHGPLVHTSLAVKSEFAR